MALIEGGGRGTGRLDIEAARRAAAEAAKRAAAEAAKKAAEAAAKAAAEAAAKAAAEAAAKKAAEVAAKKAAEQAASKANTGRLGEAKKMDFGDVPWGRAADAVAGGVAAVTGNEVYSTLKNSLSVQKKAKDIQGAVAKVQETVAQVKQAGGTAKDALAKLSEKKPPSVRPLDNMGRLNSAIRVTGGIQSALKLKDDVKNLMDGDITAKDVTSLVKDGAGALRGADEGLKLVQGTTKGFLGKMAPGVGLVASTADAVHRIDNLRNWGELSTQDKVANVAYLVGDAADIVGNFFPPAKAVGAGLALVGMAAENWGSITSAAGKVAGGVATAAKAVDRAVDAAVDATVDQAKEVVSNVADTAKKVGGAITEGIGKVFGGL